MPLYLYRCDDCNITLELRQSMTVEPIAICTQCGKQLDRRPSQSSFHLNGTGWFNDGYSTRKGSNK